MVALRRQSSARSLCNAAPTPLPSRSRIFSRRLPFHLRLFSAAKHRRFLAHSSSPIAVHFLSRPFAIPLHLFVQNFVPAIRSVLLESVNLSALPRRQQKPSLSREVYEGRFERKIGCSIYCGRHESTREMSQIPLGTEHRSA